MEFSLDGHEYITLQNLLKVADLCDTGGAAKVAITEGHVKVDGAVEIQRGKKIRAGQTIEFAGQKIKVVA
jgi:ribosome-associated protein